MAYRVEHGDDGHQRAFTLDDKHVNVQHIVESIVLTFILDGNATGTSVVCITEATQYKTVCYMRSKANHIHSLLAWVGWHQCISQLSLQLEVKGQVGPRQGR